MKLIPTASGGSLVLSAFLLAGSALTSAHAGEVTAERLLNAASEPQNWLMVNHTYDSHRFSALDQITRDNVAGLHVAFTAGLGTGIAASTGFQSTPLVEDGAMYIVDGAGTVYKADVRSGKGAHMVWVMDPGVDQTNVGSNRGVALYKNFVVSFTRDGTLNWTNVETGELVKSVKADTETENYHLTAPPLIIGDKLIVGGSGGDSGVRDHIEALNADTGDQVWRFYSVPAPGEPGSETWKDDHNAWQHGGGAFWQTGSYDPETNLTIWGTGNPVPMFDPEYRPGDNLYTNSAIGLNVDDGKLAWYFQYTPGDFLDYDEIGVHILVDTEINGEMRKTDTHFGRNGFLYVLDRTNGQFISATQYVDQLNWTAGIDPKTGKPVEYDPSKDLQSYAIGAPEGRRAQGEMSGCPNIQGGVNFMPTTYSESSKLAYGAGIEGCSLTQPDPEGFAAGKNWLGGKYTNADRQTGSITSVDPATGKKVAQHLLDYAVYSGATSTAGGLVFTTTVNGMIYALDDKTLEPLWTFDTGTLSSAPPMVYAVDGKEYVALLIGGNALTRTLMNKSPEMADIQNASMLYVFSL